MTPPTATNDDASLDARLIASGRRAIEIEAYSISSVRSILRTRLDQQARPESGIQEAAFEHCNVRGSGYYH